MTTTREYRSTDSGAPTLTGQAGSLIALLHSCLVGTVGVAYGSKAAAGWTEPFTNTSTKGVWKNSIAAGGLGCYVRVLDDGSTTGPPTGAANQDAYLRTYRTMSDLDTGTDATTQELVRKSSASSSATRAWVLIADERTFYLLIGATAGTFSTPSTQDSVYFAGDIESYIPSDIYAYGSSGRSVNTTNAAGGILVATTGFSGAAGANTTLGRTYTFASGAIAASLMYPWVTSIAGTSAPFANPSAGNSKQFWLPALIVESGIIRGRLRGAYVCLNALTGLTNGSVLTSLADFPTGAEIVVCGGGSVASSANLGALGVDRGLSW